MKLLIDNWKPFEIININDGATFAVSLNINSKDINILYSGSKENCEIICNQFNLIINEKLLIFLEKNKSYQSFKNILNVLINVRNKLSYTLSSDDISWNEIYGIERCIFVILKKFNGHQLYNR